MSEISDLFFDLSYRVRALERREAEREIESVKRRIEQLELTRGAHTPTDGTEPE
jgi:hypothetical protein